MTDRDRVVAELTAVARAQICAEDRRPPDDSREEPLAARLLAGARALAIPLRTL